MNDTYQAKKDHAKHNKARRALKDKDEKVVAMELDNQSEALGTAVCVEPTPERSRVGTCSPVNQYGVCNLLHNMN